MATQVLKESVTASKSQASKPQTRKTQTTKVKRMQQSKQAGQQGAASSSAAGTTQMNVRLGKALHTEGNAALASIGVSPSEAVRALWEKAAKRGEDLEEIRKLLFAESMNVSSHEEQLRLVQEGQQLFRNGMAQLGIDVDKLPIDVRTYEEIRDEMHAEMLKEMGY